MDWRARLEKDVNEVLQAPTVFHNVSRGVVAGKEALLEAFGSADHLACALRILDRGELEVSDKERAQQQAALFRDVAGLVADLCINPESQRPYPLSVVERARLHHHTVHHPERESGGAAAAMV